MFPPSDTDMMRPSRIPYEESSVFSQLDILSVPNELEKTCPHVVTLEAGDLLFVPSKWWHFVQCQDISITINSWVPIPNDSEVQLDEAIVRATVHLFTGEDAKKQRINPTEEMELDTDELLGTVEHLISQHSTGPPVRNAL